MRRGSKRGVTLGAGSNGAQHVRGAAHRLGRQRRAAVKQVRLEALGAKLGQPLRSPAAAGHDPACGPRKLGDFKAAVAQAEDEKTSCHLVRITAARFFSRLLFTRLAFPLLLLAMVPAAGPASAQGSTNGSTNWDQSPDHLRRYTECMGLARSEPLKALPMAEKWYGQGGGLAARHCVATAMYEASPYEQAAAPFEAIARDMGKERPRPR